MKNDQLQKTLSNLVADFGYQNVRKTLSEMRAAKTTTVNYKTKSENVVIAESTTKYSKKKSKPNAEKFVESLVISDAEKKKILATMAKKYEAKKFMPTVNHVRGFLIDSVEDVSRIKSRQQVTIAVFKQLAILETDKLREITECGVYGPPKRLEPFARAIEGFSRPSRSV